MPKVTKKQSRLVGIQYLRALAALGVVLVHLVPKLEGGLPATDFQLRVFGIGTDTLLVISGFFSWVTTENLRISPLQWWVRRMLRLFPLYWLTLATLLVILWLGSQSVPSFEHIARAFLFIPGGPKGLAPFFVPGWAMNLVFVFTLFLAFTLVIKRPLVRFLVVCCVFSGLAIGRVVLNCEGPILFVYTSPLLFEFVAGMGIALFHSLLSRRYWILGLATIAAGVLYAITISPDLFPDGPRSIRNGVPAVLFVFGIIQLEPLLRRMPRMKILQSIGDASYSIYLSHPLVVAPIGLALGAAKLPSLALNLALGVVVILALGMTVYRFIELPLVKTARGLLKAGKKAED
ncbi:MAG: acyltransferase [Gemmatimonadales bacterium]|nr:acyltransferase [Gemmatimonadales bacterium]